MDNPAVLGEIINSQAYDTQGKSNALLAMQKRLSTSSPITHKQCRNSRVPSLLHGLQASFDESQQRFDSACVEYNAAGNLYQALGQRQKPRLGTSSGETADKPKDGTHFTLVEVTQVKKSTSAENYPDAMKLKAELEVLRNQLDEQKRKYEQLLASSTKQAEQFTALIR